MHAEPPDLRTFPLVRAKPSGSFSHLFHTMFLPSAQELFCQYRLEATDLADKKRDGVELKYTPSLKPGSMAEEREQLCASAHVRALSLKSTLADGAC